MSETITVWYEITDKKYAQALRDAADRLEKTGYAKLYLENVTIPADGSVNDPAEKGSGENGASAGNYHTGGSAGGSGVGGWVAGGFKYVPGSTSVSVGFGGGGHDYSLQRAKELGKPVCMGGGGGGGRKSFSIWMFPDGHTETLEVGETPRWSQENPVRDAVHNNR